MDAVTRDRLTKAGFALLIVLSAYVVILALAKLREYPYIGSNYPSGNVITVEGKGETFAVPDLAEIGFSVRSERPTLAAAQEDAATRMNAIIAYLKGQGIDEKDIKTTAYSANPRYEYRDDTVSISADAGVSSGSFGAAEPAIIRPWPQPGNQTLVGYEVYQSVSVKVRNTDQASALIAGVGEQGASDIYGPNFTIDDDTELQREARREAIEDARAKARQLADDLGVRLVRVVSFSENGGGFYPLYGKGAVAMDTMQVAPEAAVAPELPTGENTITSHVTITYEIR